MKYVALLRGINVGGNSLIKMADLKRATEKCGFTGVSTYIQSGNIIFESDEENGAKVAGKLEGSLSKTYNFEIRGVVLARGQFERAVSEAPKEWKQRHDLRCYLAFVRPPTSAHDVLQEVRLRDGVDFVKIGEGVLYMSTLLSGITKSGFTRLVGTKVYKDITIRNYSTALKLVELMQPSVGV